jgi:hypothetical protein
MSGKNMKLLRKGAKKFQLPYKGLKSAFKKLDNDQKAKFKKQAKVSLDLL